MDDKFIFAELKQYFKFFAFYKIFIFIFLIYAPPIYANDEILTICSDPWEPWVLGDDGGVATGGLAIKLSKELFRRMGRQIEINIYPYKRCINKMKSGECDILLMVKKTKEREKDMLFSNVVVIDPQLAYYSTDKFKKFEWNTWQDFKGLSIGGVLGFDYGDFHSAVNKFDLHFELTPVDGQNIKKLLAGRIDFILLSKSTANYYLAHNPEDKNRLTASSKPISNAKFHIGLSKKGKAVKYLDRLNEILDQMKTDGSLDKITGL